MFGSFHGVLWRRVMAADALLSALEACGIDNARIEVEGNGELPVYDGSAAGWVEEIKVAGTKPAPKASGSSNTSTRRLAPPKVLPWTSKPCLFNT